MGRKAGSHAQITGPKVREAALRLFAQFGYAAVSMRQIASEVGVQAGALYTYTQDKQALLYDLLDNHMVDLLSAWKSADIVGDPMARMEGFVRFHIRHHIDRPEAVFISYMELRNLSDENFKKVEAQRRAYEDILCDILTTGQRNGAFVIADPRVATRAVIAMLTGVNTWFREGGELSRSEVEDIYWQMVRRSLMPMAAGAEA